MFPSRSLAYSQVKYRPVIILITPHPKTNDRLELRIYCAQRLYRNRAIRTAEVLKVLLPDYISVWRELANCEHEPGDANEDDLLNTAGLEFMIRMLIQVEICWSGIELGQGLIVIRKRLLGSLKIIAQETNL